MIASNNGAAPNRMIFLSYWFWAFAALRRRKADGLATFTPPLRETSASLVESATRVLRDRAEIKRREFVNVAQAQIATGAARFSDEVERRLENVVDRVPGGPEVRPLIEAAVQLALSAALEGLFLKRTAG